MTSPPWQPLPQIGFLVTVLVPMEPQTTYNPQISWHGYSTQFAPQYVMPAAGGRRAPARVASGSVSLSVCVISVYRDVYMVVSSQKTVEPSWLPRVWFRSCQWRHLSINIRSNITIGRAIGRLSGWRALRPSPFVALRSRRAAMLKCLGTRHSAWLATNMSRLPVQCHARVGGVCVSNVYDTECLCMCYSNLNLT